MTDAELLHALERIAVEAGDAILAIRDRGMSVRAKPDLSPVTEADETAERIVLGGLRALIADVPCIAEEEMAAGLAPAWSGDTFFLVDPLDGTKEFVAGRPEYTVNIALVRDGAPVLGVVHAPALGTLYSGMPGAAWRVATGNGGLGAREPIRLRRPGPVKEVVASRSHRTPATDAFIALCEPARTVAIGSSLKFCKLASGEADLYPRCGDTMQWDTAAGDAVLRAAGGMTVTLDGRPLTYGRRGDGKAEAYANPWFVAGAPDLLVPDLLARFRA